MDFVIEQGSMPRVCLPADIYSKGLINITTIEQEFARFLDPDTNEIHDCEKYFNQYLSQE